MSRALGFLLLLLLMPAMLPGCAHRQAVREPYPRWGEETQIPRTEGAPPLILRSLLPPEPAHAPACLLIVHGMNEYVGRYRDIARHFARRFVVAGFDLYAHGLSNPVLLAADRAIRAGAVERDVSDAYLAQVSLSDLEPMRRDLDRALRRLVAMCDQQGNAGRPVFILSHSLGSLVAASYLLEGQDGNADPRRRVEGIVLLGPGFSVPQLPGWRGWLANPLIGLSFFAEDHFLYPAVAPLPQRVLSRTVAFATAPLLNGLFEVLSWPGLRQVFTPSTPDWVVHYLTDSEEERARHRADRYIIRRSLLRYVKAVEREIVRFRHRMDRFATPYFLVYSGREPITPAWGSRDFIAATQHHHRDNRVLALAQFDHHEHLFSAPPFRSELLERIDRWLEQRLSSLATEGRRSGSPCGPSSNADVALHRFRNTLSLARSEE